MTLSTDVLRNSQRMENACFHHMSLNVQTYRYRYRFWHFKYNGFSVPFDFSFISISYASCLNSHPKHGCISMKKKKQKKYTLYSDYECVLCVWLFVSCLSKMFLLKTNMKDLSKTLQGRNHNLLYRIAEKDTQ